MSTAPPSETVPLVDYLQQLAQRQDRGALAALRRGLGRPPGTVAECHPHVAPFLPGQGWGWRHECCYIVASLFAMHPDSAHQGNMGDTMRRVAKEADSESVGQRFMALLKSHRDDLFEHLRHAVSLAAAKGVAVNWDRLLRDIRHWDSEDGWVQRWWAQSFWGGAADGDSSDDTAQNPTTQENDHED